MRFSAIRVSSLTSASCALPEDVIRHPRCVVDMVTRIGTLLPRNDNAPASLSPTVSESYAREHDVLPLRFCHQLFQTHLFAMKLLVAGRWHRH